MKIKGNSQADRIMLALAFVGEHKEQFEEWIKSKGGKVKNEEQKSQ